jgi:hypothetical protein
MAKMNQGILGGLSGKIGNVVGSSWKGISVLKTLPLSVANPKTAAQVSNRTEFSNVVVFAVLILTGIIKPLLDRIAVKQSGYNLFVSLNKSLFAGEQPSTPANLVISQGTVTAVANLAGTTGPGATDFTVSWDDNSGVGDALATDEAYIVIQNINSGEIAMSSGDAIRSDGTVAITVSADFGSTDTANVWMAFRRPDGTKASNTSYYQFNE